MQGEIQMNNRLIKQMFDACYMAKRTRDLLPPLPDGVQPSYIHYLDCMQELEKKGKQVRISDLSEFLNIPRPGVTRTVKERKQRAIFRKWLRRTTARVTFLTATERGESCIRNITRNISNGLLPYFDSISEEEAETMIATIEKFYQIMSGRRATYDKR